MTGKSVTPVQHRSYEARRAADRPGQAKRPDGHRERKATSAGPSASHTGLRAPGGV